jgi:hypothetical protein
MQDVVQTAFARGCHGALPPSLLSDHVLSVLCERDTGYKEVYPSPWDFSSGHLVVHEDLLYKAACVNLTHLPIHHLIGNLQIPRSSRTSKPYTATRCASQRRNTTTHHPDRRALRLELSCSVNSYWLLRY